MQSAVRQTVKVQEGGRIEVRSPDLHEGATAEVIVLVDAELVDSEEAATSELHNKGMSRLIGAAKGSFATPAEADEFIRQERDTWTS